MFHYLKSGEKLTQLDLVVPGLCGPLPEIDRLDSESISSLIACLAKADQQSIPPQSFYDVLSMLFSMDEQQPFPAAALSLMAGGQYSEQGHWFRADPVHLQADIDHAILRDSHGLDLTRQESEVLINELNEYFREEGIRFLMSDNNSWCLNIDANNAVSTTALNEVISRNVYTFMPQGDDALFWKRVMNEAQMLLHQSEVNERRLDNNKLPINGIWVWGEGCLPAKSDLAIMQVYSHCSIVKGLASLNELDCYSISSATEFIENISTQSKNLLVLDDLFNVTSYGDVMEWQSSFNNLYESWFEPILKWAMKSKIKINLYPCNGICYQISSKNKFRFFRDKRIENYIQTYE